jgi:hypothetical protein
MDGVEVWIVRKLVKNGSILEVGHYLFSPFAGFAVTGIGMIGTAAETALLVTPEQNSSLE